MPSPSNPLATARSETYILQKRSSKWNDTKYRDELERITGLRSSTDMGAKQRAPSSTNSISWAGDPRPTANRAGPRPAKPRWSPRLKRCSPTPAALGLCRRVAERVCKVSSVRFCDEHQLRKIVVRAHDRPSAAAKPVPKNKPHRRPHEPIPLIDPRLRPHLDALLDAADEVIEDWRCNDVEDGDVPDRLRPALRTERRRGCVAGEPGWRGAAIAMRLICSACGATHSLQSLLADTTPVSPSPSPWRCRLGYRSGCCATWASFARPSAP